VNEPDEVELDAQGGVDGPRAPAVRPASLERVQQSTSRDLEYVSLQVDGATYGGWYRILPDGQMELLALANMIIDRRDEATPHEQARAMLAEFIRATRRNPPV
jgi:hypothetical protein